ncbi:MAG: hypothetical protein ACREXY_02670, partial [Gammaproteobacteria bacterium]
MPQVPQYESNQVPTQVARPNFARSNFDAGPGVQAGRALAQLGDTLSSISLNEQRKADDTQLLEANRRLTQWEIEALDKPETGALSRRGKDAFGLPETILPAFDRQKSEIEAGMNARAKARFGAIAGNRRQDIERKLFDHVSREGDALNLAETKANRDLSLQEIAINYRDPKRVSDAMDLGWVGVHARMVREGKPPEEIKAAHSQWEAESLGTVLDQMLTSRDPGAVAYFEQNRARLGVRADEYRQQVDQLSLQISSDAESTRIISTFGLGQQAYAEARKIADPKLKGQVLTDIDQEVARRDRLVSLDERNVRMQLSAAIEAAPIGTPLSQILSPADRAKAGRQPGLLQNAEARITQRIKGEEIVTNPKVYDDLDRMSRDPKRRQEFLTYDFSKHWDQIAPEHRKVFNERQKELSDPTKAAQFESESNQLALAYDELGINKTGDQGKNKETQELRVSFDQQYQAAKRTFVQQKGVAPGAEDIKKILDGMKMPFALQNKYFGTEAVRSYQIGPEDQARKTVPDEYRAQIISAFLERKKRAPSNAEMLEAYAK